MTGAANGLMTAPEAWEEGEGLGNSFECGCDPADFLSRFCCAKREPNVHGSNGSNGALGKLLSTDMWSRDTFEFAMWHFPCPRPPVLAVIARLAAAALPAALPCISTPPPGATAI